METYARLASFVDQLLDTICVVDTEGRFVFVSAASERIFGYSPEEMVGKSMIDFVFPEDRARTLKQVDRIVGGYLQHHFENRYMRKDGRLVHVMWSARWSEADQLRIAVARDVTALKQAESVQMTLYAVSEAAHAAEDLSDLFQRIHRIIDKLLPAANFTVALCDARDGQLTFPYHVDERVQESALLQVAAGTLFPELVRTGQPLLLTPATATLSEDLQAAGSMDSLCWLAVPLNSHKGAIGALFLRGPLESPRYTEKDKELLQFVSTQVATAIERKQLLASLQHAALYDALTDLPNRRLLLERLESALARKRRVQGRMSLLYLDLEKFKQVNDSFGHAAGDLLLQEVARRLKQCVRESDTVARIGGDEFVILLEDGQFSESASALAQRIRCALRQPMSIEGRSLQIMPSIGIALYPEHGVAAQELLKHADEAMYFEKNNDDNRVKNMVESNDSIGARQSFAAGL